MPTGCTPSLWAGMEGSVPVSTWGARQSFQWLVWHHAARLRNHLGALSGPLQPRRLGKASPLLRQPGLPSRGFAFSVRPCSGHEASVHQFVQPPLDGAARAFLRVHSEQEFVPRKGFFAQLWMCRHGRSSWRLWLSCRDVLPEPWVYTSYCGQHNSVSNVTLLIYPGLRPGPDFYVHNTILEILILKNMPQTCSLF